MHVIDYVLRKEERSEYLTVQSSPDGEAHKEVRPLGVTGWTQGDGPCFPLLHCIIVGLVHLGILS